MNENLHHLFDGDLPDDASADLFRTLAENREQRQLFSEQMKLQGALHRNECHEAMTPDEEADMLGRLGKDIGMAIPAVRRSGATLLAVLLLGVGLLVGGGAGYLIGDGGDDSRQSANSAAPAPVIDTLAAPVAPPFDRDSLVSAIRDSLVDAMNATQVPTTSKKTGRTSRRSSGISDPTGRDAAKALAREKQRKKISGND